MFGATGTFTSN